MKSGKRVILVAFFFLWGPLQAQNAALWEKYTFKSYQVEFMLPQNWTVAINDSGEKHYIECYSPDEQVYFFLTSAENEKNTDIEIILSYLKVTYANSEFVDEERRKINNINFVFSSGYTRMNETASFIRLGVGAYKKLIFMIDSGFSNPDDSEAASLLEKIYQSIRGI